MTVGYKKLSIDFFGISDNAHKGNFFGNEMLKNLNQFLIF